MAQDPDLPRDSGKISLPRVDAAMNKVAPADLPGGKGGKGDKKSIMLGSDRPKEQEVLEKARKRFDRCMKAESENRGKALDDLKFISGESQWPADVAAQRNFDKRPCLTINKLPTFCHQVQNDIRQNRPTINVSPVGDKGDPEVALKYRGLIRFFERQCRADIAYDTASESAIRCGVGYWRTLLKYESPSSFRQTIVVQRIRNAFSVYLDPDHQMPDGSDAKYCFISELMPREEFEERYPDADPIAWVQGGIGEKYQQWADERNIRVAEYFDVTMEERTLVKLSNGYVGWKDELADEVKAAIDAGQFEIIDERESSEPRVTWRKMTGKEILDENEWPGSHIPLVKVIGDEVDIEGKPIYSGLIRAAKDAQRLYNYAKTTEVEATMLAPKAPYILEEGQVEGHEDEWRQANTKNYPYLLYKKTDLGGTPAPPPQRQPVAQVPTGIVNIHQGAAQDIMATTGIRFDATKEERLYDESGVAIKELRRSGDLGAYHYVDNLARSLRRQGDIFLDLIPRVIEEKQMMTILREDDSEEQVQFDPRQQQPHMLVNNPQTGKKVMSVNPTAGTYAVTVTVGPSFATRRIEASKSMMDFVKAMPQQGALIADLVAKNQDWEGAREMTTRLAKAIAMTHPQIMTPDIKDITPQVQATMTAMQLQLQQLQQQLAVASKALVERDSDRAVQMDKIAKDFEAKLLAIVQKSEAASQKAMVDADKHQTNAAVKIADLTMQMMERLDEKKKAKKAKKNGTATAT